MEQQNIPPVEAAEKAPVTVAEISFRNNTKTYYFDPDGLALHAGDHVVLDTARGVEYGVCAAENHTVAAEKIVAPLRKILRLATEQDEKQNAEK